MKVVTAAIFAATTLSVAADAFSERFDACRRAATTQAAMHECASEEAERANREVAARVKELVAETSETPGARAKIEKAEAAWTAYRDAYIEAMYPEEDKQAAYGSSFATASCIVHARLTYRHAMDLKEIVDEMRGRDR
jgi:uncharacterized protein YecT (DUF1311 family)